MRTSSMAPVLPAGLSIGHAISSGVAAWMMTMCSTLLYRNRCSQQYFTFAANPSFGGLAVFSIIATIRSRNPFLSACLIPTSTWRQEGIPDAAGNTKKARYPKTITRSGARWLVIPWGISAAIFYRAMHNSQYTMNDNYLLLISPNHQGH